MELYSNYIPAWFLASIIIYTGLVWLLPDATSCKSCRKIFASGFLIWGAIYGILFQFFPLDYETRGFISRTMILIICLSQSIPLSVFHIRRVRYAKRKSNAK